LPSWLENELLKKNKDAWHDYKSMIRKIEKQIENWRGNIPYFSDHGKGHSERIIERLEKILPLKQNRTAKLEENLWWGPLELLLYSAWLHDIALGFNAKDGILITPEDIRNQHHILGEQFVKDNWDLLNLQHKRFGEALGKIIYGHVKAVNINSIQKNFDSIYPIFLRNLVALIRLADALDCDFRRRQWFHEEYRIYPDETTKNHQRACELINSVTFDVANKTIYINCNVSSPSDRKIVLWYFVEQISPDFKEVKDILNSNDINWVYLKLHINEEIPLSQADAKNELNIIQQILSSFKTEEKFRRLLHESLLVNLFNYFYHKTEFNSYFADENKKVKEVIYANSDNFLDSLKKVIPNYFSSYVEPQWKGVLENFEENILSVLQILNSDEMNEIAKEITNNLADRLDDIAKMHYLQRILGHLSTYYNISISPNDISINILDYLDNEIIFKVQIRSVYLGNFMIDQEGRLKAPSKHHLEKVTSLIRSGADLLKDQISGEPDTPGTMAVVSNLISHAVKMPIDEYDIYLHKAIHSILAGVGLLSKYTYISDAAQDIRDQLIKTLIDKFSMLSQNRIISITNDLSTAICNYKKKKEIEPKDVEQAFILYENLLYLILEIYGMTDLLQISKYNAPNIEIQEPIIRMFSLWTKFSNLPIQHQSTPVLVCYLLAFAFILYGLEDISIFSKIGEDLNTTSV